MPISPKKNWLPEPKIAAWHVISWIRKYLFICITEIIEITEFSEITEIPETTKSEITEICEITEISEIT